jgi:hypothetical protein
MQVVGPCAQKTVTPRCIAGQDLGFDARLKCSHLPYIPSHFTVDFQQRHLGMSNAPPVALLRPGANRVGSSLLRGTKAARECPIMFLPAFLLREPLSNC